jgi:hypothetical protein
LRFFLYFFLPRVLLAALRRAVGPEKRTPCLGRSCGVVRVCGVWRAEDGVI